MYVCMYLLLTLLLEVAFQVGLKVKVADLVSLLAVQDLAQLVIGVDVSAIVLAGQVVGLDVVVDLLADGGAGHLGSGLLAEELGELVADLGGGGEARGLAITRSRGTLLLGRLASGLELALNRLGKGLVIRFQGVEHGEHLLKLGRELSKFRLDGHFLLLDRGGGSNRLGDRGGGRGRGRCRGGNLFLGLGRSSRLRSTNHFIYCYCSCYLYCLKYNIYYSTLHLLNSYHRAKIYLMLSIKFQKNIAIWTILINRIKMTA